jgi:CubicO group peptidase (beta-lactamase class C family)
MEPKLTIIASILRAAVLAAAGLMLAGSGPPAPPAVPAGRVTSIDTQALGRAVDRFFTDPALADSRALIIIHRGQLLTERYGAGFGPQTRFLAWSMAKSVTAVLIGKLVSEGRLQLDAPAPVPAWSKPGDPRGAITLRHLLQMSAGLAHRETGAPLAEAQTVRLSFTDQTSHAAAFAVAQPLIAKPGSAYTYSSASSIILADIIGRTVTSQTDPQRRRAEVRAWMDAVLFKPAQLDSFVVEFDESGTFLGGAFMHATARDWARFGEVLRTGGNGIITPQWLAFMRTPAATDPGYGGHVWLNRARPKGSPVALFPGKGPASLFAAVGYQGQFVLVSPDQSLTVVRLGKTVDSALQPVRNGLGSLVGLFPARSA